MRVLRPIEEAAKELPWIASAWFTSFLDPAAYKFCERRSITVAYEAERLVNVLPQRKLIYIFVPKAASTRIRQTLAKIDGRHMRSLRAGRHAKFRGPYGPRSMTMSAFFRLVTHSDTLRFSFVRNPYARAVSCWAD